MSVPLLLNTSLFHRPSSPVSSSLALSVSVLFCSHPPMLTLPASVCATVALPVVAGRGEEISHLASRVSLSRSIATVPVDETCLQFLNREPKDSSRTQENVETSFFLSFFFVSAIRHALHRTDAAAAGVAALIHGSNRGSLCVCERLLGQRRVTLRDRLSVPLFILARPDVRWRRSAPPPPPPPPPSLLPKPLPVIAAEERW